MAKPTGYGGRDYPDFGISDTFHTKYVMSDMGELAARLGSPSMFDRTGTIIWYEQFIAGFNNWQKWSSLGGVQPVLVANPFLYRPYAIKLFCASTVNAECSIQADLPFPYESALGIEFAYWPQIDTPQIRFIGKLYSGTKVYSFGVYFNLADFKISVRDSGGNPLEVYSSVRGYHIEEVYNIVKIVLDLKNKQYGRIMFNKYDLSVSGIAMQTGNSSTRPSLSIIAEVLGIGTYASKVYVDNFIVTLNEPL